MFAFTFITILLAMVGSSFASPAPRPVDLEELSPRKLTPDECGSLYSNSRGIYHGVYEKACVNLIYNCASSVAAANSTDIWSFKSCVAAATCQGTTTLVEMARCFEGSPDIPDAPATNSLNYNVYANIVGGCAWQQGGCPITQQNYIDFVYSSLSDIGSDAWPDFNNVVNNWWGSIKQWAATGDTVPYLNFNDWLHYSA